MKTIERDLCRRPFETETLQYPVENFTVLSPLEFLHDLKTKVQNANNRVRLQAMHFEFNHATVALNRDLMQAAQRGVNVQLHIDDYARKTVDANPIFLPTFNSADKQYKAFRIETNKRMFSDLDSSGVKVTFVNQPDNLVDSVLFMKGRNHIKMAIVDDVAWIGGMNYLDPNFRAFDLMVKITDKSIVDALEQQFFKVDRNRSSNDYEVVCTPDTKILVDSGRKGESIILDEAVALVNGAKASVWNASQFLPDGRFLDALYTSYQNGVDVKVITSPFGRIRSLFDVINKMNQLAMVAKRKRIPLLTAPEYVHAKILIIDGKTVLIGSHNLSSKGPRLGTEEIALVSTNEILVNNLSAFYAQWLEYSQTGKQPVD